LTKQDRLDDQVISSHSNGCCHALGTLSSVQGRAEDTFIYDKIFIHPYCFRSIFLGFPEMTDYQVVQTQCGICLKLKQTYSITNDVIEKLQKKIIAQLVEVGIECPEVTISFVNEFSKTSSGKQKRFIPRKLLP
jgi:phenylacetate-coenzyme A ligase PaaK-like adenylate-forming protein